LGSFGYREDIVRVDRDTRVNAPAYGSLQALAKDRFFIGILPQDAWDRVNHYDLYGY
jgi:hypothetical protein